MVSSTDYAAYMEVVRCYIEALPWDSVVDGMGDSSLQGNFMLQLHVQSNSTKQVLSTKILLINLPLSRTWSTPTSNSTNVLDRYDHQGEVLGEGMEGAREGLEGGGGKGVQGRGMGSLHKEKDKYSQ